MKRFITYLYGCERGDKAKHTGFLRVTTKGKECTLEIFARNCLRSTDTGVIYALIYKERLQGIALGEIQITKGQSDQQISFSTDNIMESGYTIDEVEGIALQMKSGMYLLSPWRDTYENQMLQGEFEQIKKKEVASKPEALIVHALKESLSPSIETPEDSKANPVVRYEKINLAQIQDLPSSNWHLSTNSFLLHGFWNYGYLVLKKEMEKDEEMLSLGVPGIFEKPEAVMAILFGFPQFEEIEKKETKEIENDVEPQVGTFGGWFTKLKK